MVQSKSGIRILGMCAIVLGIMAFGTSTAQAQVGASWSIIDSKGTLLLIPGASDLLPTLQGKLEAGGLTLLATIAGVPTAINCLKAVLIGTSLLANGSLTNGGKVKLTECTIKLNGKLNAACTPRSPAVGEILTNEGKGLIYLHKLMPSGPIHDVVRLEPKVGTNFVTLKLGEECSIGEEIPVAGELTIWEPTAAALEYKVEHLFTTFEPLTKFTALGNPATFDGSALFSLAGAHVGLTWLGKPA